MTEKKSREPAPQSRPGRDRVDATSMESFPASDAPSWSPLHAGAPIDPPEPDDEPSPDAPTQGV
jgi:hypothetical protein